MSHKVGRAIAWDNQTTLIEFDAGCDSCQGCASSKSKQITVTGKYKQDVQLNLSSFDQSYALFNSLMLPILMAIVMAFIADWLHSGDWYGIILVFGGFTLGMALCQRLSPDALIVEESSGAQRS